MAKKLETLKAGICSIHELMFWPALKAIHYLEAWHWKQAEDPNGYHDERIVFDHDSGFQLTLKIGTRDLHNEDLVIVYDAWCFPNSSDSSFRKNRKNSGH